MSGPARAGRPRRAPPITLAASAEPGDMAPGPFARQHGEHVAVPAGTDGRVAWRNTTQTLLDRHLRRGTIDRRQWAAGERLRRDLHQAALGPRTTADLGAPIGGGRNNQAWGLAPGEHATAARRRVRAALEDVGRRLADILVCVVWNEIAASAWAEGTGVDASSARPAGMMALRLALDALADHYRLPDATRTISA